MDADSALEANDPFPNQLKKFCVFCGAKPEGKNKEHIIPQWLIRLTGAANRVIPMILDKQSLEPIYQSPSSFVFPACQACNNDFSDLENRVSHTMQSILKDGEVSEIEISELLDWFDKVRVGLWLADMLRNKDFVDVERNFHIADRVGKKDRLLFIYKANDEEVGFSHIGLATYHFHMTPSCFGFVINNLYFFNISIDFLLSHKLGLPHIRDRHYDWKTGQTEGEFESGKRTIKAPLFSFSNHLDGIFLFQACFPHEFLNNPEIKPVLESDYVASHSLVRGEKSRIFASSGAHFFSEEKRRLGIKNLQTYDRQFLKDKIAESVLETQKWIGTKGQSIERNPKDERNSVKKKIKEANQLNDGYLAQIHTRLREYTKDGQRKLDVRMRKILIRGLNK